MTERIEFATKEAADRFRDEHEEHLCSDDDRRLKTVAVSSDTPERIIEQAAIEAAVTRAERDGTGQLSLEPHERDEIDFSQGQATVPWARAVKAIMRAEGVDDWLSYADPSLSVDEHRDVAQRAARDEQGDRLDAETSVDDRLASVEGFRSGQCDSAETHCEEGDETACDFLVDECGVDEEEVQSLLSDFGEEIPADKIEGRWMGALKRTWDGYHGAVREMEEAIQDAREARENAEAAAKAVNGIRRAHGQDEIERFGDLEDALMKLAAAGSVTVDGSDQGEPEDDPEDADVFERDVGSWQFEGGDDDRPRWRLERDRMDGGELLVTVATNNRGRAEVLVGNLDELVREVLGTFPARREALEAAVDWMEDHPDGVPVDWFYDTDLEDDVDDADDDLLLADDRHLKDDVDDAGDDRRPADQGALVDDLEDGADGPSREFRAAQQDGYLRQSDGDEPDEREGLGQFGARRSDTKALEDFEDDA